ncbi:MAG TPA: hypothetical protein VF103_03285 [Polyangiaceae bacterium]
MNARSMWALERNRPGVVLVRRRPARAVTLAGTLGAVVSLVPLLIAPDPGVVRFVTFAVLALSSASLVFLGRARPEQVELVAKAGGLVWGDEPLPPPAHVVLSGDDTEEPPTYCAFVVWADGKQRLALERSEPAGVLADSMELSKRLELDLRPGWGLENHFGETHFREAWESTPEEPPPPGSTPSVVVDLPLWPVQRNTAVIALVSGIFVLVVTWMLARSPERSVAPSAFALVLPGLSASIGIALGTLLFGIRRRLERSGHGIVASLVLFGVTLGKKASLTPAPRRVFGVAPIAGPVRHALFSTSDGPFALSSDARGVARLALPAVESDPPEAASAELGLATSPRYRGPDRPARLRS